MGGDIARAEKKIERNENEIEKRAICRDDVREGNILIYDRRDEYDRVKHEERVPKPFRVYHGAREIERGGEDDPERMHERMPIDDGRAADREKFRSVKNYKERQDRYKNIQPLFIHGAGFPKPDSRTLLPKNIFQIRLRRA